MVTFNTGELLAMSATAADIAAARAWLKDNEWADMDAEEFDALTPVQILRGVNRHYFGGLAQFYKDGQIKPEAR